MVALAKIRPEQGFMAYQTALNEGRKAEENGRFKEANALYDRAQAYLEAYVVHSANILARYYNMKVEIEFDKFGKDHHNIEFIGGTYEQQIDCATDLDTLFGKYKVAIEQIPVSCG